MSTPAVLQTDDLYQRGLAHYRGGDFDRCRACADQALALDPRNSSYLILKGMALTAADELEEAIDTLQFATQISPDNVEGWRRLAQALMTAGELKEAVEAFRSTLRLRPDHVPALVDLGNILFMLGRVDEAVTVMNQARLLTRSDLSILRNLAEMYVAASRPEPSLGIVQEILAVEPGDIVANCDAAWLYLQINRCEDAVAAFRTLRQIDPEHELYALHGIVMAEIRHRAWRRALDIAIEATRLDRFELTTTLLAFVSGRLFGKRSGEITEQELQARFETVHREHRRLHAETYF